MTATTATNEDSALQIGDAAPDFNMPVPGGKAASLHDLKGKNIVLYFYPKDSTPGCTQEAKDFRDNIEIFNELNTEIIGVSKDSISSHAKFAEKHCLPFRLGSDETSGVCEAYGVWKEKSMYGKKYIGIERTTLLIDGNGIIRQIWPKVKVTGHVDEVIKALKAL